VAYRQTGTIQLEETKPTPVRPMVCSLKPFPGTVDTRQGKTQFPGGRSAKLLDADGIFCEIGFMDGDERDIFQFLKTRGTEFVNGMEIARRAGNKKRFYDEPDWAKVVLMRMEERGILESDPSGRYRIKPVSRKDKNKRWVAPDIAKILNESGVEVDAGGDIASDEYYEEL
jgi:hypothetical protein